MCLDNIALIYDDSAFCIDMINSQRASIQAIILYCFMASNRYIIKIMKINL